MDPVSAIGLIASIVTLISTTTRVIEYLNATKDAPQESKGFLHEVLSLVVILDTLRSKVKDADPTTPWVKQVCLLAADGGPLNQFEKAIDQLEKKLKTGTKVQIFGRALVWPLARKDVTELLVKVERLKSTIEIALHHDHFSLSLASKAEIDQISQNASQVAEGIMKMQIHNRDEAFHRVVEWLSPLNFFIKQNDVFEARQDGTGLWILNSSAYKEWETGVGKLLWCPGIPGSGKTILTSVMVDSLRTRLQGDEWVGVACAYCNFKERNIQTPSNLIAALWRQLAIKRDCLTDEVQDLYNICSASGTRPNLGEISKILRAEIDRYNKVFIFVDALDEYHQDWSLVSLVSELRAVSSRANLLITSRFDENIETMLDGAQRMEICADAGDMRTYIAGRISRSPRLARHAQKDPALVDTIASTIIRNAGKMFLLAQLHMDSLETQTTLKGVRKALMTLPQELNETYHGALQRIRCQITTDRELAERILSWISYALRPMTWKELQCALAVEMDESELDEENLPDKALLTSLCAGLVMIDPNSNIIRLVHYTAQEYFARIRTDQFPDAPVKITMTCLTYLLFDLFAKGHCLDDNEMTNRLQEHPFLRYAARNWGHHAYGDPETQISDLILKFLDQRTHVTSAVQVMLVTDHSFEGYSQKFPRQAPALWVAAYFGLENIARTLLGMGADPAAVTSNGETALHQAAANGHIRMVRLLKEAGADLEMEDHVGGRAIHRAAANGQDEVVLWLMNEGVAFNAKDQDGVLPLHLAASKGHVEVVRTMVDKGASVEVKDNSGWIPLHWASRNGHNSIVDFFLKRDVNNDARTNDGETPLHWAARNGHSEVARLLLDNGANVEPKDQYGWTALYRAAETGHLEVARLLIERGAYADAKDEYDWAALRPEIADDKLIYLLREQRTDVEVKYDADWSALSLAVEGGTHTVAGVLSELGAITSESRMLVERWRDVEADNSSGWTALHRAARNGHLAVTRLLVEHGADVNARDSNGWSPLHGVARNGNYLILPVLLEFGADVEAKDSLGRTALDGATQMGHDVLVQMLLDHDPERLSRVVDVD